MLLFHAPTRVLSATLTLSMRPAFTQSIDHVQVLSRRYSDKYEPEAEGLDAFSCQWAFASNDSLENNWVHLTRPLHSPYSANSAKQHAGNAQRQKWASAHWWQLLGVLAQHLKTSRYLELGPCAEILTYPIELTLMAHHLPRGQILALRLTRTFLTTACCLIYPHYGEKLYILHVMGASSIIFSVSLSVRLSTVHYTIAISL